MTDLQQSVAPPGISRQMTIQQILALCPDASDIMASYGLHCFSCAMGGAESLEEGCAIHGFDDETFDALLTDLNDSLADQPQRPQKLIITKEAAEQVQYIAEQEDRVGEVLIVLFDERGEFCMEFQKKAANEHLLFQCKDVPDISIGASPETLWRIGGATIDYRDERFKLDLPDEVCCGGAGDGSCGCAD